MLTINHDVTYFLLIFSFSDTIVSYLRHLIQINLYLLSCTYAFIIWNHTTVLHFHRHYITIVILLVKLILHTASVVNYLKKENLNVNFLLFFFPTFKMMKKVEPNTLLFLRAHPFENTEK